MTGAINRILLSEDANRTNKPTLELSVGQCVLIEVEGEPDHKTGKRERIVFQMHDAVFKQWAKAFNLFAEGL